MGARVFLIFIKQVEGMSLNASLCQAFFFAFSQRVS